MEVGEALITRLGAGSATNAIVGTRVFWVRRPQAPSTGSALPAVVLTGFGGERPQNLEAFEDMRVMRIQASAFATTHSQARQIAEALIADLAPAATVSNILFWRADVEDPRDLGEETESVFVHHTETDFTIRYARA